MSNEINIEELERLAKAATPGPWKACGTVEQIGGDYKDIIPTSVSCMAYCYGGSADRAEDKDLIFIAAANPSAVLSLIDRLKKAEAEVEQFRTDARRFRLAEKNLFDAQEAAKTIAKQAIAAEAERDDLAAKLAEMEGQEPVAWAVMNGWAIDGIERSEKDAMAVSAELQKSHDLSGSLAAYRVSKLYARPVPVEMSPDFTDTARAALLWVLWHHQGGSSPVGQPIRYALGMDAHEHLSKHQVQEAKRWAALTKSESNDFRQARTAPPEPVNARLLSALIQCRDRFVFYVGHHLDKGDMGKAAENEKFVALANEAISAAEAQQDRLLQDMHDAGREIDRVMAEATPKAARLTDKEIASLLAASDKNSPRVPSFFMTEPHKFARAIETAVLRKNGLALED